MATPFLSSEEYDERAHKLYDKGDYEAALDVLKEGLRLYPHSVELYVGVGYTRLAREEYVWAKQAFERALVLDPEHEDGLVGMGETLLRFGHRAEALTLFARSRETGGAEDLELLMTMGRALYRERMYEEARTVFAEAVEVHADSAEAAAAFGYTLHRMGEETAARRQLRRSLQLDSEYHEARIYLAHLLYDRGDWVGAAREFERVAPAAHYDSLAVWRLIELKRALEGLYPGAPELRVWEQRLEEIEGEHDPVEELLAELEAGATIGEEPDASDRGPHRVQLPNGGVVVGTWEDILQQIRDAAGQPGETVAQFMRRKAAEAQAKAGLELPAEDPQEFLQGGARAGFWQIEY